MSIISEKLQWLHECFVYPAYGSDRYAPEMDWHAISRNLYSFVCEVQGMVQHGHYREAAAILLEMLYAVAENYEADEVWCDESVDGDDFCTRDAMKLLAQMVMEKQLPLPDVQDIAARIGEIEQMEAYRNYALCNFALLKAAVGRDTVAPDDYLALLDKEMRAAWQVEDRACMLADKIRFLQSLGRTEEADALIEANMCYYQVCNIQINDARQSGNEEALLAALQRAIGHREAVEAKQWYGRKAVIDWRKQRLALFERRQDRGGVIAELWALFLLSFSERLDYYERLKTLLSKEELRATIRRLVENGEWRSWVSSSGETPTYDILVEQQLCDLIPACLSRYISSETCHVFAKYAHHLTPVQQAEYIHKVVQNIRKAVPTSKSKSYSYWAEQLSILRQSCPQGATLVADFVEELRNNHGNRPALMRWLDRV